MGGPPEMAALLFLRESVTAHHGFISCDVSGRVLCLVFVLVAEFAAIAMIAVIVFSARIWIVGFAFLDVLAGHCRSIAVAELVSDVADRVIPTIVAGIVVLASVRVAEAVARTRDFLVAVAEACAVAFLIAASVDVDGAHPIFVAVRGLAPIGRLVVERIALAAFMVPLLQPITVTVLISVLASLIVTAAAVVVVVIARQGEAAEQHDRGEKNYAQLCASH